MSFLSSDDISDLTDYCKKFYDYPDNISELTDEDTEDLEILKSIIDKKEEYVESDCFELEQFVSILDEHTNGLDISSCSEQPQKKRRYNEGFDILIRLLEEGTSFFI